MKSREKPVEVGNEDLRTILEGKMTKDGYERRNNEVVISRRVNWLGHQE